VPRGKVHTLNPHLTQNLKVRSGIGESQTHSQLRSPESRRATARQAPADREREGRVGRASVRPMVEFVGIRTPRQRISQLPCPRGICPHGVHSLVQMLILYNALTKQLRPQIHCSFSKRHCDCCTIPQHSATLPTLSSSASGRAAWRVPHMLRGVCHAR
jgi:hypothetical protein